MKNITLKIAVLAALLSAVNAQAFELETLGAADIKASQAGFRVPAPRAEAEEDMIGVDVNVRLPYGVLKNVITQAAEKDQRLSILDKNAPVAFKSGDFMRITNIQINQGGIMVNPTLTLKPYLAATDKLAIRVQRVQLHAVMEPSVKAVQPQISEEQVMEQVMDVLIKTVYTAVNDYLKKKSLPITAEKVIRLSYDKAAWTLYGTISSKEIHNLISPALMGELHLTGFGFNEKGLTIKVQTAN